MFNHRFLPIQLAVLVLVCMVPRGFSQDFDPSMIKLKRQQVVLPSGVQAAKIETGQTYVYQIAFSPGGDEVALVFRFAQPAIFAYENWQMRRLLPGMRYIEFSPDGKQFVTAEGNGGVRVWDSDKTTVSTNYLGNQKSLVRSAVFSPDGSTIASAHDDGEIKLWNVKDLSHVQSFHKHDQAVHCVRFSPSGDELYSCGEGKAIEVWDLKNFKHLRTIVGASTSAIMDLAVSKDGKMLVSTHQRIGAMLWNLETGIAQVKSGYFAIACSPKDPIAAVARDKLLLFNTDSGKKLASIDLSSNKQRFLPATMRFTPDGNQIAIGGISGEILLIDVPETALSR